MSDPAPDAPPLRLDARGGDAPDDRGEARLFWRLRRRTALTQMRQLLRGARLRTALVVALSVFFWGGLFALFYAGFVFLISHVGTVAAETRDDTIEFVFHLFFASLNVMLVFSAGIIMYGGLFSSEETRFLLTQPVRPERIVLHKFQEALLFSSWGFFLLASPLTIAFGLASGAPWHYYALIGPLILAFVYIPSGFGALCCLLLVYRFAHLRMTLLILVAVGAVLAAGAAVWDLVRSPNDALFGAEWFNDTIRRFRFTREAWLPSSWLSRGLLDAARPRPEVPLPLSQTPVAGALMHLVLLVANALMCRLLLVTLGGRWLRKAFSQLECRPRRPRVANVAWVDRLAERLLSPFPQPVRLLLVKDWRLLRRDPVQWSQFLIFFGLLALYFLNVDRFGASGSRISYVTWINMVSFLNLAVVGLILSTFTTRFIYPMISLEGRRFWVLGLMPVSRETIVWSKFLFASLGSLGPCALLILVSDLMLRVGPTVILVHQFTTVLLCSGLASLAVGLGATMPDFSESSPSKIAAGFGGTLNLVLSACYIIAIVVLIALPCHFYLLAKSSGFSMALLGKDVIDWWLIVGSALAVAIAVVTTVVPLRRGVRAFNRLEIY